MKLVEYIKSPQENVSKESWKYLIKVFFLYIIISYLLRGLTGVLKNISSTCDYNNISIIEDYPLWFVIVIPVLIEEFAFRLALKRKLFLLFISSLSFSFICSAFIFNVHVYSWDNFIFRITLSILISLLLILIHKKLFCIKYNYYFYIFSILFALLHVINFDYHNRSSIYIIINIINTILIIPSGIILGYVRVSYGFLYAIIFHLIHNYIPMSLYFIL